MSLLFTVENKAIIPYPETLLIFPFKEIWARDKTKDKRYATEDFTYIEFVTSQKASNPYAGYSEEKRAEKVKEDIITREGWKVDNLIQAGIDNLIEFQEEASPTYTYYMACRNAAEELKNFFNTLDMSEINIKTGLPKYKPKEVTSALNDVNNITNNLHTLKTKVEQEIYEATKTKGQKIISPFAKGLEI